MSKLERVSVYPTRILWIDPKKIENIGVGWGPFNKLHEFGKVVNGIWDLNTMPFEDLDVYQSFKARFVHETQWENTTYYKVLLSQTNHGIQPWGVRNKSDLVKRLNAIDELYKEMKRSGYKTQQQLLDSRASLGRLDEVTVRIGRHGEFIFEDGRHRLAIAKILGLSRIPVLVTWRHKKWFTFKEEIVHYAKSHGGRTYQPITHPDLSDISSIQGDTRFRLINSNLPFRGGSLLDIGAHWGYMCHKFEDEGFRCYAVETDPENFYFLNKLRIAEKRKFTAVRADISVFWEKNEFDAVLALHVFHHYLKSEELYNNLIRFLRCLRMKVMFFEPHLPSDSHMHGAYRNYSNEDFVKLIAKNTGLRRWECIGYGEEARPIYKLTKK